MLLEPERRSCSVPTAGAGQRKSLPLPWPWESRLYQSQNDTWASEISGSPSPADRGEDDFLDRRSDEAVTEVAPRGRWSRKWMRYCRTGHCHWSPVAVIANKARKREEHLATTYLATRVEQLCPATAQLRTTYTNGTWYTHQKRFTYACFCSLYSLQTSSISSLFQYTHHWFPICWYCFFIIPLYFNYHKVVLVSWFCFSMVVGNFNKNMYWFSISWSCFIMI